MSYLLIKTRTRKNKNRAPKPYSDVFEVESYRKKIRGNYSSPKQKIIGKIGSLREFSKIHNKEINIESLKDMNYENCLKKLFSTMLENYGFIKKGELLQNNDVVIDISSFEAYESKSKKSIAIHINGGFISTKTMQDLVNIKLNDLEDDDLYKKSIDTWRKKANNAGLYDTFTIDETSKLNKKDIYSIKKELTKKLSEKKIQGQVELCQYILHQHPDYKKYLEKIDTTTGMQKQNLEEFNKEFGRSAPKKWSPRGIGK